MNNNYENKLIVIEEDNYNQFKNNLYLQRLHTLIEISMYNPTLFWKSKKESNEELLQDKFILGCSTGTGGFRTSIYVPNRYWKSLSYIKEIDKAYKTKRTQETSMFQKYLDGFNSIEFPNAFGYIKN